MNMHKPMVTGALFLLAALTGCGGGGGGGGGSLAAAVVATSAQGAYEGMVSNGFEHNTLVLENDQVYTIYGQVVNNQFAISGFIQANGKSNNGSFSATDLKDFPNTGAVISGSLSASYSPNSSFNGTLTEGASSWTFTGAPIKKTMYDYDSPANLAHIVGAWNLSDIQGNSVVLNIGADQTLTGSSGGCHFSGTIAPRPSGKNVFNVALTFGTTPCASIGQSASGIAVEYPVGQQRQLLLAGTNTARTSGTAFVGVR